MANISKDGVAPVVGQPAPEFALTDVHGGQISKSDCLGQRALIVFFPFAFTGICSNELTELRDARERFAEQNVRVLAISCDPIPALKKWDQELDFGFDLLSDFWPHGEVSRAYGVFDDKVGRAGRGSFLLDEVGILRWSVVNEPGEARPLEAYFSAVSQLR